MLTPCKMVWTCSISDVCHVGFLWGQWHDLHPFDYLHWGGNVIIAVCVCVSAKYLKKLWMLLNGFWWNFVEKWGMAQGGISYILCGNPHSFTDSRSFSRILYNQHIGHTLTLCRESWPFCQIWCISCLSILWLWPRLFAFWSHKCFELYIRWETFIPVWAF